MKLTLEQILAIEAGCEGVTPGPWQIDDEKCDGNYGNGEDIYNGYQTYMIIDNEGRRIVDASNSDVACIKEHHHEYGCDAWDETAKINTSHIARFDPATVKELCRLAKIGLQAEALEAFHKSNQEIGE